MLVAVQRVAADEQHDHADEHRAGAHPERRVDADVLAELARGVRRDGAAGEAHEGVRRGGDRRSTGAAPITASVIRVLLMPRNAPATMIADDQRPSWSR